MKKLITIVALLFATNLHAGEAQRLFCADSVGIMRDALYFRNNGDSPEYALERTKVYENVSEQKRKEFIYLVYMSPVFAHVSANTVQREVMMQCMGWKK